MHRHLTEDELVLHYYGEMSDAAEERALEHLDGCDACRGELARLQRALALVEVDALPRLDAGFEARIWKRLEPALVTHASPLRRAISPMLLRLAWGAAAAVLVLAAFVAGRSWPDPSPATVATLPAPSVDRVLIVDLGDHLDRAELALSEFIATSGRRTEAAGTEDLIAANRLYRGTAMATGDQNVVDVLDELERALIEIATTSPDAADDDIDAVRDWIEARDLLFKMRLIREMLQERAPAAVPRPGQDATL